MVGAYAVTNHALPRFTKDLNLWVEASPENPASVHAALTAFGAPLANGASGDLANEDMVYQIGVAPNRIDNLMGVSGLEFSDAWPQRVESTYGECPIQVISRQGLVCNKRAAGRSQDLIDLRAQGEDVGKSVPPLDIEHAPR